MLCAFPALAPALMSASASHLAACENCTAALHGDFCHQCGQSAHSPVRSFGHAVEEVFESFWHLDGRIFRTLRQLLLPGRLAASYLAGHRARYVPPMRLFVILSVLTFFVARLAVHVDGGSFIQQTATPPEVPGAFRDATSSAEVEQVRRALVAPLAQSRQAMPERLRAPLDTAIEKVEKQAVRRNQELAAQPAGVAATAPVAVKPKAPPSTGGHSKPVQIDGLPDFVNHWLDGKAAAIRKNLPRVSENPQLAVNAFFSSVPSVLFVLVPLFALLLKVFYVGSGRLYLEHLVVALYSHAFLCVGLLGVLLLSMLGTPLAGIPGADILIGLAIAGVLVWMPIYLLVMQRRVYGESWLVTSLKFTVLGWLYFSVVTVATALLALASLANI